MTRTSSPSSPPPTAPPTPGGRTGHSTPSPWKRLSPDPVEAAISPPPPVFFHTPRADNIRPYTCSATTTTSDTERMTCHDRTGTEIRLQPQPEARPYLHGKRGAAPEGAQRQAGVHQ